MRSLLSPGSKVRVFRRVASAARSRSPRPPRRQRCAMLRSTAHPDDLVDRRAQRRRLRHVRVAGGGDPARRQNRNNAGAACAPAPRFANLTRSASIFRRSRAATCCARCRRRARPQPDSFRCSRQRSRDYRLRLTAPDPTTTYTDAVGVLKRRGFGAARPNRFASHLERGDAGRDRRDAQKPTTRVLRRVTNVIIGDNTHALDGRRTAAARSVTRSIAGRAARRGQRSRPRARRASARASPTSGVCVIAGGEPVVTVKATARAAARSNARSPWRWNWRSLQATSVSRRCFAGTDGIDGPTDAAGRIRVSPTTVARGTSSRYRRAYGA